MCIQLLPAVMRLARGVIAAPASAKTLLVVLALGIAAPASAAPEPECPPVTSPPDSFFQLIRERDRDVAHSFYKKYLDVRGMPLAASAEVADQALQRTYEIVTHMLAGRPDILQAMVTNGMYLIIIGRNQVYTDMPEYRHHPNPAYQNERVRGTGGKPTSFGEENVLCLPIDRYDDESIGVHEFCHTIDGTLRAIDPGWNQRRNAVFRHAVSAGLWTNTYAGSNPGEFWAEVSQAYFDCGRPNNWNHGPIARREQLKAYDPETYELVRTTFNLGTEHDWRYAWLQKLPNVIEPPPEFKLPAYYTKFTWAREFTVVGRGASDAALLKANDTIRKMFAYRHDILKALIADGAKLVVLGPHESLAELPELQSLHSATNFDATARFLEYSPETKLMVVREENVLGDPREALVGDCEVIREFAKALYEVCGHRPVDPNWDRRGRDVQQYEMRVQRLDMQFDQKVRELYAAALQAGHWKGSPAAHDPVEYWAAGVLAYFDATGQLAGPSDRPHAVSTRAELGAYDPGLFQLVSETMAYDGHVDWRYPSAGN